MGLPDRCLHQLIGDMTRENGLGLGEQLTEFGGEVAGLWAGIRGLGSRGEAWWWDTDPIPSGEHGEGQNHGED